MNRIAAVVLLIGGGLVAGCSSHEAPAASAKPAPVAPAKAADTPKPEPAPPPAAPQPKPDPTHTEPHAIPPQAATGKTPDAPPGPPDYAKEWLISIERAKELFDKKEVDGRQVIFVDARTFNEFREGHIRGAMCYSTKYTQGAPQPKLRNYLPGSAVVIYCHGDLCTDSYLVGRYFKSLNMDIGPVFVIKDGLPGWQAKYPNLVDKGDEVGFN